MRRYVLPALLWTLIVAACSGAGRVGTDGPGKPNPDCPKEYPCSGSICTNPPSSTCPTPDCQSKPESCTATPYVQSTCYTTPGAPARANVILGGSATQSTNMLYCQSGRYALCFFSGPPGPTGNSTDNPHLPCVVDAEKNVAHCVCESFFGPYFVDINAIENYGVYNQTVSQCQADGSGCANIQQCGTDGSKCTICDPKTPVAGCLKEAPVCKYVDNQFADAKNAFYPGASLISTFSFALSPLPPQPGAPYSLGSTDCTGAKSGLYAGCMTAPCFFEGSTPDDAHFPGAQIRCDCPLYNGPFQVGQDNQCCAIPSGDKASYVWSAAYTAPAN